MSDDDLTKRFENVDTLANIANELGIKPNRLIRWSDTDRNIGFPKPIQTMGRFKLYDKKEIEEWIYLWEKVTKNMHGNGLSKRGSNGTR